MNQVQPTSVRVPVLARWANEPALDSRPDSKVKHGRPHEHQEHQRCLAYQALAAATVFGPTVRGPRSTPRSAKITVP